ncbi:MAG: hypothetical protein ACPGVO_17750 [Spirulinaceae cyanobacterium]
MGALSMGSLFLSTLGFMGTPGAIAQDVALNEAMTAYCQAEGIAAQACECWFSKIAAAEAFSDFTAQDIQDLAPYYQEELAACQADNA